MQQMQQPRWGGGGGAPQVGQPVAGQPVSGGGPVPIVQGMAVGGCPPMGQPYGQPHGNPYGMPPGGAPVVIGAPTGAGADMTHIVVEELSLDEVLVLRYRFSLMCFAVIDAFSSIFHAGTSITAMRVATEGGSRDGRFQRDAGDSTAALGLLGVLFLIGPICGLVGAKRLQRPLVGVYFGFCVAKTGFEIFLAVYTLAVWYILIALVQMWVTRIVFSFWRALGKLTPQRIQELRNPGSAGYGSHVVGQPVRIW